MARAPAEPPALGYPVDNVTMRRADVTRVPTDVMVTCLTCGLCVVTVLTSEAQRSLTRPCSGLWSLIRLCPVSAAAPVRVMSNIDATPRREFPGIPRQPGTRGGAVTPSRSSAAATSSSTSTGITRV